MDFISSHALIIDGASKTIQQGIKSETIAEISASGHLTCRHETQIPPCSIGAIPIKSDSTANCDIEIHPTESSIFSLAHLDDQGHTHMLVNNPSHDFLTINRGATLAAFVKVTIPETSSPTSRQPKSSPLSLTESQCKTFLKKFSIKAPSTFIPDYKDILVEFYDIFSHSDYDLAWTDLISHDIKMSSTAPVYTKQFRIPVSH